MKDKKSLMAMLSVAGATFGYYGFTRFSEQFKCVFLVLSCIAIFVYISESIRNKYKRIHIVISILALVLNIAILMTLQVINHNTGFYISNTYILIFIGIIITLIFIISILNFMKTATAKQALGMKILIAIMLICIFIIIVAIIAKS